MSVVAYREIIINARAKCLAGVIRYKKDGEFKTLIEHEYEGDHAETMLEDFLIDNPEYNLAARYHI